MIHILPVGGESRRGQRCRNLIVGTCKTTFHSVVVGAGGSQRVALCILAECEVVPVRFRGLRRLVGDGDGAFGEETTIRL